LWDKALSIADPTEGPSGGSDSGSSLNKGKLSQVNSNLDTININPVSYKHHPSLITHLRSVLILSSDILLGPPKVYFLTT
jgi:hypothetical protein